MMDNDQHTASDAEDEDEEEEEEEGDDVVKEPDPPSAPEADNLEIPAHFLLYYDHADNCPVYRMTALFWGYKTGVDQQDRQDAISWPARDLCADDSQKLGMHSGSKPDDGSNSSTSSSSSSSSSSSGSTCPHALNGLGRDNTSSRPQRSGANLANQRSRASRCLCGPRCEARSSKSSMLDASSLQLPDSLLDAILSFVDHRVQDVCALVCCRWACALHCRQSPPAASLPSRVHKWQVFPVPP